MATYRDIPVTGREIRVLEVAAGAPMDDLVGQLTVVSLDDTADYEAISYVWGSSVFSQTISLPTGPLAITASLDTALRRFRLSDRKRRVWADSICINQGDTKEKGVQVGMMGDIYRLARRVLIWVGTCDEAEERNRRLAAPVFALWMVQFLCGFAVENRLFNSNNVEPQRLFEIWDALLEAIICSITTTNNNNNNNNNKGLGGSQVSKITQPGSDASRFSPIRKVLSRHDDNTKPTAAVISSTQHDASRLQQLWRNDPLCWFKVQCPCECKSLATVNITLQSFAGLALESLGAMLAQPWFGRMWVLQEAVLAQDAIFHYGRHAIPLEQVYCAVSTLSQALNWCKFGAAQLDVAVVERANSMFTIVGWGQDTRYMALGMILKSARNLQCSEPRDRVYGLLSMVDQESVGSVFVQPDYTVPLAKLWARVAAAILTSRSALPNKPYEVLCLAGLSGRQRPLSRPSWAPDFGYLSTQGAAAWERKTAFLKNNPALVQNPLTGNMIQCELIPPSASGNSKLDSHWNDEHWDHLNLRGIALTTIHYLLPDSQFPKHPQERLGVGVLSSEQVAAYAENSLFPWYIRCIRFLFDNDQAIYESWKPYLGLYLITQQGSIPFVPPDDAPPSDALAFGFDDGYVSDIRMAADRAVATSMVEAPARIHVDSWQMVIDLIFFLGKTPDSWDLDLDRVLAVTHDKKFAWVPSASQPGDSVVLCAGVPVPLIIRMARGQGSANVCELVGDAYVRDVMGGQAWQDDDSKLQKIDLV